ncbi:MAG: cob(I)yrinic acid a,c-diamide adenosyltransferase [Kiritimatiellae bacterium]|nr:cob(I)yrinic acid a,c-diamide adenosyltransferase [Kiritimatiellia bacterium]
MPGNEDLLKTAPRILIFTGDGKGKTTAALGMVLRACGHSMRCLVLHFIKSEGVAGEYRTLRTLPGVEVLVTGCGFAPPPGSSGWEKHRAAARRGWELLEERLAAASYDLIVLDEVLGAVKQGLIDLAELCAWLERRKGGEVIVLTGRDAPQALIDRADTVSEIKMIKHAYLQGEPARVGVEF